LLIGTVLPLSSLIPLTCCFSDELIERCSDTRQPAKPRISLRSCGLLAADQMIEQLARLSVSNFDGTVELLGIMFAERTPVFDIDDKLKGLLKKLYVHGHQTEVLRMIDKLQKTLPEMLSFYKELRSAAATS
jgi:hypothetical protein